MGSAAARSGAGRARDPKHYGVRTHTRSAVQPPLCASVPRARGVAVFSVYQTDVVCYGDNLADYIAREFKVGEPTANQPTVRIAFWSDLAEGGTPEDL